MSKVEGTSFIYIIGPHGGPHKIGHSMDTERRVKQLQRGIKGELMVLGKWPVGTRIGHAAERYTHWLLRAKHYRGEWFNVSLEEAKEAITYAINNSDSLDAYNLLPPIDQGARLGKYAEHITTKYKAGTSASIEALKGNTSRAEFIREAVEKELQLREAEAKD